MAKKPFFMISSIVAILAVGLIPLYYWRFNIANIPTNFIEILITISVLSYLVHLIWGKKIPKLPYLVPVILILSGILIAALLAPDKRAALGIFKGWFLMPVIFGWLITNLLSEKKEIQKWLLAVLLININLVAIYALFQWLKIIPLLEYQNSEALIRLYLDQHRAVAFFESPNYLAMYLSPLIAFFTIKKIETNKYLTLFWLLLPLTALIISQSLGGITGLSAALIVYLAVKFFLNKDHKFWFWLVVAIVSIICLAILPRELTTERISIYRVSWDLIKNHWLLGIGSGQFQHFYTQRDTSLNILPYALHSHNVFLNMWLSGGLLALLGFVFLIIQFFRSNIKNIIVLAGFCALLVIFAHGMVDTTYFKNDLAIIFWFLASLLWIDNRSPNDEKSR